MFHHLLVFAAQTELNSREGAWERLCLERDPLVLSGLMWSWLAQLKDPVVSRDDVRALSERKVNPQKALDSLEKVSSKSTDCGNPRPPKIMLEAPVCWRHKSTLNQSWWVLRLWML